MKSPSLPKLENRGQVIVGILGLMPAAAYFSIAITAVVFGIVGPSGFVFDQIFAYGGMTVLFLMMAIGGPAASAVWCLCVDRGSRPGRSSDVWGWLGVLLAVSNIILVPLHYLHFLVWSD